MDYTPEIDAITTRSALSRRTVAGRRAAAMNHSDSQEHHRLLKEDKARREAEADAVIARALARVGECRGHGNNMTL